MARILPAFLGGTAETQEGLGVTDGSISSFTSITVPGLSEHSVEMDVAAGIVAIDIFLKAGECSFSGYLDGQVVVKSEGLKADDGLQGGNYRIDHPGKLRIVFDNTRSFFTSSELSYKICMMEPPRTPQTGSKRPVASVSSLIPVVDEPVCA